MNPLSYLIVGSGYRSKFYARIARTYPSLFKAMFLCRSEEKASLVQAETGVPATCSMQVCEEFHPDLIIVAVNKQSIADVCIEWARRGYPVLTETPVGFTKEQLLELWKLYEGGARIAVSEQYFRYPDLIPGLEAIKQGLIGTPGSVHLSLAHDYHGISLIRRMLLADGESYVLHGERTAHPVTETDSRTGPIPGNPVRAKNRDIICITYDSGKTAVYDFSGVQYHSFIRSRHLVVRGDRGEWCDTILYRVDEEGRCVRDLLAPVVPDRYLELDTAALRDMRRVWRPDLAMDNVQDEFAIASLLYDIREYLFNGAADGEPAFYTLREALDDAYFRILMEEAVAEPWKEIRAEKMPWMQ